MRKGWVVGLAILIVITGCGGGEPELFWRCDSEGKCGGLTADPSEVGGNFVNVGGARLPDGYAELGAAQETANGHKCAIVDNQVVVFAGIDLSALGVPLQIDPEAARLPSFAVYNITDGSDPLDVVDSLLAQGIPASPHHLLAPAPVWKYGPSGAPISVVGDSWITLPGPYSTNADAVADGVPRIIVIDTGGTKLADESSSSDAELEPPGLPELVRGHGTFVRSIARSAAGDDVIVDLFKAFPTATLLVPESVVVSSLGRSDPSSGDIVNISLGTYPCRDGEIPLLLAEAINGYSGVHFVAAAGNDAHRMDDPVFFPAGFGSSVTVSDELLKALEAQDIGLLELLIELPAKVTSVGALAWDGEAWVDAPYSNEAEVYMPGSSVVGHHPDGTVEWSGTSFAAPNFAGCLAVGACDMSGPIDQ